MNYLMRRIPKKALILGIDRNDEGALFYSASENSIKNNDFVNNGVGASIWSSSKGNKLFSNIFMGNHENAYDKCWNKWKNNYWDNWAGLDNPMMRWKPYNIPGRILLNFDWYPENSINKDI